MMLTKEEEQEIRQSVRHGLQRLGQADPDATGEPTQQQEQERLSEAERIIADETERYYTERGLVKHTTRSGRVVWLSQEDLARRGGRSHHGKRRSRFNRKVALVWAATILVAVLLTAYLVTTANYSFLPD